MEYSAHTLLLFSISQMGRSILVFLVVIVAEVRAIRSTDDLYLGIPLLMMIVRQSTRMTVLPNGVVAV